MIKDEELIQNVEGRIAYDNSQKDYAKRRNTKRRILTTICSLALVCALTIGVDAATNGAISSKFKSYFYNADGTKEELPVEMTKDENGRYVYKFSKQFTQNGQDLTVEGSYYDNDGTIEFGQSFIYDENGNVVEDAIILNYAPKDEAEEEEFDKMFKQLQEDFGE